MYKNVHINSIHNSPNQKTKQMLNYRRMNKYSMVHRNGMKQHVFLIHNGK